MRILIAYPWLDLGGAPKTAIALARGLKERGHEVHFLSRPGGLYEARLRALDIPLVATPHHRWLPAMYQLHRGGLRILRETLDRERIDLVHTFHPHLHYLALFAAPARNIPVVFTAVWFLGITPFPAYPGRVLFVAEEFKDVSGPLFGNWPREMTVLPNRIELDHYHPGLDPGGFPREHDLAAGGWRLAFMSRMDKNKIGSLRQAVQAVGMLAERGRPVQLALAGDGPRMAELRQQAEALNARLGRPAVKLLGPIADPVPLLSWADLVLGVGRCAWEGMACAKPTIVVGEKGLAGVVEPGRVEALAYHNFAGRNVKEEVGAEDLARAVASILDDPVRTERLGTFARDYVVENYDHRVGAAKLEQVYERALADPPLSGPERRRLLRTNLRYGLGRRLEVALRLRARELLGRART